MNTIEDCFEAESALVYGIGGGGDIVGSIPTARLLELMGVDVTLGGIAWEREPTDPHLGPRRLDDFAPLTKLSETVGLITKDTVTDTGIVYTEAEVASFYDTNVALLDISHGIPALQTGITEAAKKQRWDLIIGTDSGGDALAQGDEPGIRSPLADGISVVTLSNLELDSCLGVFGYGSDGELTHSEIEESVKKVSRRNGLLGSWGLSRETVNELESLLDAVDTEASRLPVQAAKGEYGVREIRGGERSVQLSPSSTITFFVSPTSVAEFSNIASALTGTNSLGEANEALKKRGMVTELPNDAVHI